MKRLIMLIAAVLLVCNLASAKPPTDPSEPDKIIVSGFVITTPSVGSVILTVPTDYIFIMTDIVANMGKDLRFFEGEYIPDSTVNMKISVMLERGDVFDLPAPLSYHFQSGIPFAAGAVIVYSTSYSKEVTISGYLIPE